MRTLGRIAEAESHLREALAVDPHHSVTHNNLGNVLKDQGRLDDGIDRLSPGAQVRSLQRRRAQQPRRTH